MKTNEYKKININICENGYVVETPETSESFVFSSAKKMKRWLEDHTAQTGQCKDFCEGLDKGSQKNKTDQSIDQYWNNTINWNTLAVAEPQIKINDNTIDNKFFDTFEQNKKDIEIIKDALKKLKEKNV